MLVSVSLLFSKYLGLEGGVGLSLGLGFFSDGFSFSGEFNGHEGIVSVLNPSIPLNSCEYLRISGA